MFSRIELPLHRSILLALILSAGWSTLAACLVAAAVQLSLWLALTLIPVASLAASSVCRLALLRGEHSVMRVGVNQGQLHVNLANGRQQAVIAHPNSRLYGRLALLKLSAPDAMLQEYTVCLVDLPLFRNTDPDAFRRLRVWLRFSDAGRPPPQTSV